MFLIRHGESTLNRAGIKYGTLNPPLTEAGMLQALMVAEQLRGHVRGIVSSPLRRAQYFAELVAATLNIPEPEIIPGLRERSFGAAEGLTPAQIATRWPDGDIPGMESIDAAAARALPSLEHLRSDTAVITHAGVIKGLTGKPHVRNGEIVTYEVLRRRTPSPTGSR